MSHLTKRKIALIFCLGVSIVALAIVVLFTAKIYKADAQGIETPCYPITGQTRILKVKVGNDPITPDTNGIANAGIIDFDDISILGENHRACVEIQPDGELILKGWAINKKPDGTPQLGLVSFYCNGPGATLGENRNFSCKDTYGVMVNKNGNFIGQAYNDFIGKFNFSGINLAGVSNMKLDKGAIANGKAPVSSGALDKWSWSDRVGWFDFSGVKMQVEIPKCIEGKTECTIGVGACKNTGKALECNADGTVKKCDVLPKPGGAENTIAKCSNNIDDDCDRFIDGADPDCKNPIDGNGDVGEPGAVCTVGVGACKRTGIYYSLPGGGVKCSVEPGAPSIEICGDKIDNNCDDDVDEGGCCNYDDPGCPPKPEFKCGQVQTSGNTKLQSDAGVSLFSVNRGTVVRGIAKAKMENDYAVLTPPPDFNEERTMYYYQNTNADIAWNGGNTDYPEANKTIIVEGGDVYINSNFYNPSNKNVQIGIIALKSEYGHGGNVYIKNTVANLQAQIFADGGVYSYAGDPAAAMPPSGSSKTLNVDFWRQLVIEGTVTSQDNTDIAGATERSFACLRPVKSDDSEITKPNDLANFTNVGQSNNEKRSVFIFYRAPDPSLPVFGGFAGTGLSQGN